MGVYSYKASLIYVNTINKRKPTQPKVISKQQSETSSGNTERCFVRLYIPILRYSMLKNGSQAPGLTAQQCMCETRSHACSWKCFTIVFPNYVMRGSLYAICCQQGHYGIRGTIDLLLTRVQTYVNTFTLSNY